MGVHEYDNNMRSGEEFINGDICFLPCTFSLEVGKAFSDFNAEKIKNVNPDIKINGVMI
ncbi:hypothetical protein [Tepidibacter sp. Z1-5]|uniref:hypothetical protein n=1 Tax=Tepidibacter sp. Z1-5 TaxID=3134138 RepID=UPI0030BD28E0